MWLFNLFKGKNKKTIAKKADENAVKDIPESEKKYYQMDSYYVQKSHEGTPFEREVILFDKRKKTAFPSENGLYVPEILMLYFCKKYPNPKDGYPGYWWFQYGIRDVGSVYSSLIERGFIRINEQKEKYELTELGRVELEHNAYVPYMHSHSKYITFTVWDLNLLFGTGDKSKYKEVIDKKYAEIDCETQKENKAFMSDLKVVDPEGYRVLKSQDKQIAAVQAADAKFLNDKELDYIITFWEKIWENGGPNFEGSFWMFRLPDLYIKAKKYDDALGIVNKIKKTRGSYYSDKVDRYIKKIEERKSKENAKRLQ